MGGEFGELEQVAEDPPYILVAPKRRVELSDAINKYLLLKTPSNCYRLPFLKKLFPNASFKVIYLTRNPAASINGLLDGWNYRYGFYSFNIQKMLKKNGIGALNIKGYSDKHSLHKYWWNFDMFPGWENHMGSALEIICSYQWLCANQHCQNIFNESTDAIKIKFEDIAFCDLAVKRTTFEHISTFIDIPLNLMMDKIFPYIQVTRKPNPHRWKEKANIINPLLRNKEIKYLANINGYNCP